jgi:very-short-patch-repair endonuclease
MSRIRLQDLAPAVQDRIGAQYGIRVSRRAAGSPFADRLWAALDARFPGRVQREYQPLTDRRYRIDFAFPEEKVAIEFDGYRYHGFSRDGFRRGLIRQNALVMSGWRVLRYSLTDVRDRLEEILEEITRSLHV